MKIALIHGQNHRGSTWRLGRMLAEQLTEEEHIKEVFLPRDMPEFCCGCTNCFLKNETLCPHHSYVEPITKILDEADVLIFTTPVYVYHATGSMKAFLDHYGYRWMVHRPEESMFFKQAVCLSTAAGGGMRSACRDVRDSLFYWGVAKIDCYGAAIAATSWSSVKACKKARIEKKIRSLARKISRREGRVRPGWKTKAYFYVMRMLHKGDWNPPDVTYWEEKGWNKKARPWKPGGKPAFPGGAR